MASETLHAPTAVNMDVRQYGHFIKGTFIAPSSSQYFDSENPTTGEVWARVFGHQTCAK